MRKFLTNLLQKGQTSFHFSITNKITVVYTFIFSILLLLSSIFIMVAVSTLIGVHSYNSLLKNKDVLSRYLETNPSLSQEYLKDTELREQLHIFIKKSDNTVLYSDDLLSSIITTLKDDEDLRITWYQHNPYLTLSTTVESNNATYQLFLATSLNEELKYVFALIVILIISYFGAILLGAFIGAKTSRKMLSPIATMTKTVKSISANKLDTRLNISTSQDELKELAETFNEMLDRIQKSYQLQKQFVSDASHELRTPIAVIQGYADLLKRWGKNDPSVLEESVTSIQSEANQMKELVEKLLFLARGEEQSANLKMEWFSITELMEELVKETIMIDSKHDIINHLDRDIPFYGDRKHIKQALRVLVDNSVKYTPAEGTITLSATVLDNEIHLVVADTGIGIPEEDLSRIFTRFYRVDKSRTKASGGNGLGLSIAQWIIEEHHGSIKVKSILDMGTSIYIVFPHNLPSLDETP